MNTFYVYAYIRSKNSKTASAGTPYYIGKGKGTRAFKKHSFPLPINSHVVFLETNLSEIGAFALERRYIKWWGRKDLGTGILLNRTDGGDGISGAILGPRPPEVKEKISKGNLGKKLSEETKLKISNSNKGKNLSPKSPETKRKMSIAHTGKEKPSKLKGKTFFEIYGDDFEIQREKRSKSHIGKIYGPMSEEHKLKIRNSNKNRKHIIVECPHCKLNGAKPVMNRWHFENCKDRLDD